MKQKALERGAIHNTWQPLGPAVPEIERQHERSELVRGRKVPHDIVNGVHLAGKNKLYWNTTMRTRCLNLTHRADGWMYGENPQGREKKEGKRG